MDQTQPDQGVLDALGKSVFLIDKLERELAQLHAPIAILGMSCRFPGAASVDAFWKLLVDGVDAITEAPPARWDAGMDVRHGGFVDDVDQFDALFFGISPKEAARIDPQQRMLLEVGWEALEHAGLPPGGLRDSRTGVFVGLTENDYARLVDAAAGGADFDPYDATGTGFCFAAGRLSHALGLRGPNLAIDTGCSSSLVAVHQAVASLRAGECDLALAGGAHLRLALASTLALSRMKALSSDGRCKAFDASADGFGRSEGCGLVVLKRLADARQCNDRILAVIRGSAVNHDGAASGFTVPSERAQTDLVRDALRNARVAPDEVGYLEAHGTGTALGDPIEVGALAAVFGRRSAPLSLGSIKSNIGHAEGAAGIAGLMKAVLMVQHGTIPRHLHFERPNPLIPWNDLPFSVATRTEAWPESDGPRIAGVSSFGMSGTNAHVVVTAAPPDERHTDGPRRPLHLLALSAKTPQALRDLVQRYRAFLEQQPAVDVADLCFTANAGRSHFEHRLCVIAASADELAERLAQERWIAGRAKPPHHAPAVAFRCGPRHRPDPGSVRVLSETQPTFRRAWDEAAGAGGDVADAAFEWAMVRLWRSWGIEARVIAGAADDAAARALAATYGLPLVAEVPDEMVSIDLAAAAPGHEWSELLETVAHLHVRGVAVDWSAYDRDYAAGLRKITLPLYPFQRERYWVPARASRPARVRPLLDRMMRSPRHHSILFETEVGLATMPFLDEHRIDGTATVPAACHLAMIASAAEAGLAWPAVQLRDVAFPQPLEVGDRELRVTQVILTQTPGTSGAAFELVSGVEGAALRTHATGSIIAAPGTRRGALDALRARVTREVSPESLYDRLERQRIALGPAFRCIDRIWLGDGEVIAGLPPRPKTASAVALVALLDACLQTTELLEADANTARLPFAAEEVLLTPGAELRASWIHARRTGGDRFDVELLDDDGIVVISIRGFTTRPARRAEWRDWLSGVSWEACPGTPRGQAEGEWRIVRAGEEIAVDLHAANVVFLVDALLTDRADDPVPDRAEIVAGALLRLTQRLASMETPPRLWVVTRFAQAVRPGERLNVEQSVVWGLVRAIAAERPELRCVSVDWDELPDVGDLPSLLTSCSGDARVAVRNGQRYVEGRLPIALPEPAEGPRRLALDAFGSPDDLRLAPLARRAPAAREVEIEVRAAGLNFRDVLIALGMLDDAESAMPARDLSLGFECAGIVAACGNAVTGVAVGDAVIALTDGGSFGGFVNVDAARVRRMPAGLDFAEAATIPMAYLTAYRALRHLAHVQAGERVLIHCAAGGVGQAAVQVARAAGAEIYATASPAKWPVLRAMGIEHVMSSRSGAFAGEVLEATRGRGVDVVLNCLTGDLIARSVDALAYGGRFVEIGKLGTWSAKRMAELRPDVAYLPFDLGTDLERDPAYAEALFGEVVAAFEAKTFMPLPATAFPIARAAEAYRLMENGRSTGKLVLTLPSATAGLRREASYLITGGLGSLGLQTARRLAARGAAEIILAGRRGESDDARDAIEQMRREGTCVRVVQADVSKEAGVRALLAACNERYPLRGIIHAAGVLDDGVLSLQTPARLAAVFAPKVRGAWHLHRLSRAMPLDFFVAYSSVAALLNEGGQGTYAAANAFLDALMQHRRACGLPGLSINWGSWAGRGMAAGIGGRKLLPEQALDALLALLPSDRAHVAVVAGGISATAPPPPAVTAVQSIRDRLAALRAAERIPALRSYVATRVATVLEIPNADRIDEDAAFSELGVDSLTSIELRNLLQQELGVTLPPTVIFDYPTIARVAGHLLSRMQLDEGEATIPTAGLDDEVRSLLDRELELLVDEENHR